MNQALSELKLTIILFAICLGYAMMTWLHRLVKHYYRSDVMFFGLGIGMMIMVWACVMRYRNYRKLAKNHEEE